MKFCQLDQIIELSPGQRIVALRRVTGREEYLRDHFPRFPVLPGVLMLEALFQAAAWLIYATEDFRFPVVTLKEARNIKFTDFVEPGETLTVTAEVIQWETPIVTLKAQGAVDGTIAVSGRLVVDRYGSQDRDPRRLAVDGLVRRELRELYQRLTSGPATAIHTAAGPPPT
ncbi:MAG: beta-hydroxyacyl-ACP dehydratase [Pirellulaceae bacterium]|nr:MAG: beta-hydroxyacyl-ACP dehydratase [Pirellulaceae bacterium]